MKKLLGSTLALALFIPASANAELLKNLKFSGQLDVEALSSRNVGDFVTRPAPTGTPANNDRFGHAYTRAMLRGDWDVLDDVHARVTLAKGGTGAATNTRAWGSGAQSLNGVQDTTFVQEANVRIDKLMGADATVGRQFFGEPGDLIAYWGPRDNYGLTVTALDAVRADWAGDKMTLTGLAGRTADSTIIAAGNVTQDVRALIASLKGMDALKPQIALWNRVTHATGGLGSTTGKNDNLWILDLRGKLTAGMLWLNAELAQNFGEDRGTFANNTNYKGTALLLKGGVKLDLPNMAMARAWGEFGGGSGDANYDYKGNNNFQSIATDYRPGGIYGRFDTGAAATLGSLATGFTSGMNGTAASNGLTNRLIWGAGVNATPSRWSKLTAGLQYYRYAFNRVAPVASGVKPSRNIGSEVDLTAEWKHSENVSLKGTLGDFLPGAYINDLQRAAGQGVNPVLMAAADLSVKF